MRSDPRVPEFEAAEPIRSGSTRKHRYFSQSVSSVTSARRQSQRNRTRREAKRRASRRCDANCSVLFASRLRISCCGRATGASGPLEGNEMISSTARHGTALHCAVLLGSSVKRSRRSSLTLFTQRIINVTRILRVITGASHSLEPRAAIIRCDVMRCEWLQPRVDAT